MTKIDSTFQQQGTIDGDQLAAPTTTKRGGVKETGANTGEKYLRVDDSWASPVEAQADITVALVHAAASKNPPVDADGQTIKGDTASGGNLTLRSTAHATKGKILFGTSGYDEVNNRIGIGTSAPICAFEISGMIYADIAGNIYAANNISGLSFTDRTPAYIGNALSEIRKIMPDTLGKIDHATLPEFARHKRIEIDAKGKETEITERNLGNMVSILTKAIQELDAKNKEMEEKIENMDATKKQERI